MPADLIAGGVRGVSLLEFFAVGDEDRERLQREQEERQAAPMEESIANERARQTRAMLDAARAEAKAEARRDFEAELEERLDEERARVTQVCGTFAKDRQRYFAAAEAQVVKLAIAIARKVLAREVAVDPMHLTAVVRAALARVHDGSASVLRVRDRAGWVELFSKGEVSVVADERLMEGECVLETEVGRVELGVEVQMGEIERGFGELLRRSGD